MGEVNVKVEVYDDEVDWAEERNDNVEVSFDDDVDWAEEPEDSVSVKSLFDTSVHSSVESLLVHELEVFGFDLRQAVKDVGCNDQSVIMLINFIRSKVASVSVVDTSFTTVLKEEILKKDFLSNESNMLPVLPDDSLLYLLHDTLTEENEDEEHDDEWQQNDDQVEAAKQTIREALPNFNEITSRLS